MTQRTLDQVLETHGATGGTAADVAGVVAGIGRAAKDLHALIAGHEAGSGDGAALTATAEKLVMEALANSAAAGVATPADAAPRPLNPAGTLLVTIDVLGGGAELDINLSPGLVFAVWPTGGDLAAAAGQPGLAQLAAGLVMFGPRTVAAITLCKGTALFQLGAAGAFVETDAAAHLPHGTREYAIDASAYRHWDSHVRAYIDECVEGADGPAGVDFTMRWSGSLVAEAYRILRRGGVFLQPKNGRTGTGGASLTFDAAPLALLIEQAGGEATTGYGRILDIVPKGRDHRVTLIFGSADHVGEVARSYDEISPASHRAPLFGARGLFRE
ncbi:MAG: class 1 fructose-bisphosphatase [Bauldia sp.]|nr:class 1 fructose-bisphosphatase [Bauldia sp.]